MKIPGLFPILVAAAIGSTAAVPARAAFVLDQSNVVNTFNFDAAVVTGASRAQTFTVGLAGTLARVDLEIYKSTNSVNDPVFEILGTTGGVPDITKVLYQSTISLSSIPTFDSPPPGAFGLTSVDVSAAGLAVTKGQVLALALFRNAPGTPPWLLWRNGVGGYSGGASYFSGDNGGSWAAQSASNGGYEAGFQTFVTAAGGAVPEPSSIVLALIGLGGLLVPLRLKARKGTA